MRIVSTYHLNEGQITQVMALWNAEYPEVISYNNIDSFRRYLYNLEDTIHRLIVTDNGEVKGWYVDFMRNGERWFVLVISKDCQGKGFGRKLMQMAQEEKEELNGWVVSSSTYKKLDGSVYMSPLPFYTRLGVRVYSDITFEDKGIRTIKVQLQRKPPSASPNMMPVWSY